MKIEKIPIEKVIIQDRVREEYGDMETLKSSIRKYGLLNPIIIDGEYRLIAGGRRLKAVRDLGFSTIEASILDEPNNLVKFDLEMQENLVRKDFTEQEINKSIEMKKRLLRKPFFTRVLEAIKRFFRSIASFFKRK